jgi:transcriptional regulator with GAF, ATPase, and Fis domain
LLENELFGHEKGAFTGANARKSGKAEMAHRGTLFLDEIGDMPLALQSKILRLVQEKQFERVGGLQTLTVDVRVVAATNRDLRAAVEARQFREDLFFRLSVFPIDVPPLRRRRADIPLLAEVFLDRFANELGRRGLALSQAAREALAAHSWPGNVRELQNTLERAAILSDGPTVEVENLRLGADSTPPVHLADVVDLSGTLDQVLERVRERAEQETVARALQQAEGDKAAAAKQLGLSLNALNRRLRRES